MAHNTTVFRQLLDLLPRHEFDAEARQHQEGQRLRVMSRWAQFVALGLGQLGGLQSLRDIFCHITANWRGTPLTTYETIVDRIGNTRTEAGLQVQAELDSGQYPTGVTVTKSGMDAIALVPDEFHGDWNYKLVPR